MTRGPEYVVRTEDGRELVRSARLRVVKQRIQRLAAGQTRLTVIRATKGGSRSWVLVRGDDGRWLLGGTTSTLHADREQDRCAPSALAVDAAANNRLYLIDDPPEFAIAAIAAEPAAVRPMRLQPDRIVIGYGEFCSLRPLIASSKVESAAMRLQPGGIVIGECADSAASADLLRAIARKRVFC